MEYKQKFGFSVKLKTSGNASAIVADGLNVCTFVENSVRAQMAVTFLDQLPDGLTLPTSVMAASSDISLQPAMTPEELRVSGCICAVQKSLSLSDVSQETEVATAAATERSTEQLRPTV